MIVGFGAESQTFFVNENKTKKKNKYNFELTNPQDYFRGQNALYFIMAAAKQVCSLRVFGPS